MSERRAPPPRKRTFKAATLQYNRAGGISGIVKNLSETGAMIEVTSVVGIPDQFTLFIEADHFRRNCKVIWRQPTKIGVLFI